MTEKIRGFSLTVMTNAELCFRHVAGNSALPFDPLYSNQLSEHRKLTEPRVKTFKPFITL